MTISNEKRRRILLMYLQFAHRELEIGRALPRAFVDAIETWGKARFDEIDRQNAIQVLMPAVEADGFTGTERFIEVAKRLDRYRGADPDDRLIRSWWESGRKAAKSSANDPKARSLFDDETLNRVPGRPRKRASHK